MMPRWHHSDSSSERYQEVKSIKTFYAAHISRSQAKSMFGNWTKGHPKVIILSNYDGLESPMLHTKLSGNRPIGSGEDF